MAFQPVQCMGGEKLRPDLFQFAKGLFNDLFKIGSGQVKSPDNRVDLFDADQLPGIKN